MNKWPASFATVAVIKQREPKRSWKNKAGVFTEREVSAVEAKVKAEAVEELAIEQNNAMVLSMWLFRAKLAGADAVRLSEGKFKRRKFEHP